MNNNLPIKYDNSLFKKIKDFIRRLFKKDNKNEATNFEISENINEENELQSNKKKEEFQNYLKAEVKNDYAEEIKKEEVLDNIEKDQDRLYKLPISKLKKIELLFKESVEKHQEILENLKKKNANI